MLNFRPKWHDPSQDELSCANEGTHGRCGEDRREGTQGLRPQPGPLRA